MTADEILALSDDELCDKARAVWRGRVPHAVLDRDDMMTYSLAMRLREMVFASKKNTTIEIGKILLSAVLLADKYRYATFYHDNAERGLCRAILQACLFAMEVSGE